MNAKRTTIGPDSEVILHCKLLLEDGTVAEDTTGDEPICLRIGDGTLLGRLEEKLIGLHAGDNEGWDLPPDEAFGPRDPSNVRELERDKFPANVNPEPGQVIAFTLPDGDEVPGGIISVEGDQVTVDFNHPLAGHTVRFEVEIVAVAARGKLSGESGVAPPSRSN
jgi:FKBP-type peptidyl-prolyl cis-trans isomerase SlpA